jgi:hypothetical protein
MDPEDEATEIIRRQFMHQYSVKHAVQGNPMESKPFSFLTNIGGKETS